MPIAFVRILDEKGALVVVNNTNKWHAYLKMRGTTMGKEIDGEGGRREGKGRRDGLIGRIPSGWRWWWLEEERRFGFRSHWIENIYNH